MAKLVKFKDGKFVCWSRVDLDNGDPIWVSVAHNGVMVKKSKWGLRGEKLYNANALEANRTAMALLTIYSQEGISEEYAPINKMTNHLLVAFTLAAMVSDSASQLSIRLNSDLEASALEKTLQFKEKFDKIFGSSSSPLPGTETGSSTLKSINDKVNKSAENSKTLFEKIKKIIPNKQATDEYFSFNNTVWDSYARKIIIPDGWKKIHSKYHAVGAFDPNTHLGFSLQLLFKDDNSPPTTLIIGNYYPSGSFSSFADDIKTNLEKEAVNELGPQYSISASFIQAPPFEIIELRIMKK